MGDQGMDAADDHNNCPSQEEQREWRCTFGKSKQNEDNDKNLV